MAKENHLLSIPRPRCHSLFLALVILCVLQPTVAAQNVTESFTPFLNASDLGEIDSDGNGNLWMASNGGVLRFNVFDRDWEVFHRLLGRGPRGNDVSTVAIDARGKIWVGSATRGFTFYDPVIEVWDRDSEEWPDPRIRVVRALGQGVYIGTQNGLSLKPTLTRTDICADTDPGCIVPSFVVNDYALLGDTLWVATQGGLGRFNGTTWDSSSALPPGSIGQESVSIAVFEGVLWEANPVGVRRLVGDRWESFSLQAHRLKTSSGLFYAIGSRDIHRWDGTTWIRIDVPLAPSMQVRDLEVFSGGMYLTTNLGLAVWEGGVGLDRFIPPGPQFVGVYSGTTVDSRGDLWAGTSENLIGLVRYDEAVWTPTFPSSGGLLSQWIPELLAGSRDEIWVGHCCCFLDPVDCPTQMMDDGEFTDLDDVLNVRSMDQDGSGRVWAATKGFGVEVLSETGGPGNWGRQFNLTSLSTGGALTSDAVTSVLVTSIGTYMGHESGGLDLWPHGGDINFGQDGSTWIHIGEGSLGLLDGSVGAMAESGEDVWVGTSGGLHRFRGASMQERCPTRDRDILGDPARKVNAMVADGLGGLWVGTDTGLLYLPRGGACDAGGGDFAVFTDENSPLPDNRVLSAVRSPVDGSLWFGTSEGLLRVDPLSFTGSAPPPDKFVLYPNPIRVDRRETVVFGIEVGGIRVIPVSRDMVAQPEVFDITGQRVGAFEKNNAIEGGGWSWNGENINGDHVAPGIYIVRAEMTSGEVVIRRLGVMW